MRTKTMDPISDMLNRIKNGQAAGKSAVEISFSNLKYEISQILLKNGFLGKVEKKGKKNKRTFEVTLRYNEEMPVIGGVKRISKPGQRIYFDYRKIRKVKDGYGMAVISTSKGLLTDKQAKKEKVGGEILFEIW